MCYALVVRRFFLAAWVSVLAGCPQPGVGGECETDADCGGNVCARDHFCWPASDVRSIKVTWTVNGQAASPATCGGNVDLFVDFDGPPPNETVGFIPVPCELGQFVIDKLPDEYDMVEVGVEGVYSASARITGSEVAFDLPL